MNKKIIVFLFALIILLTSYKQEKIEYEDKIIENKSINNIRTVNIKLNNKKVELDLEDYVIGVVSCEMPASFDIEALKAMAVAARTFAVYKIKTNKNYVLSTTTKDQCYLTTNKMKKNWKSNFDKNYNKIKSAVMDTKDEIMTYNDKVIIAFYFSISNGYTENCEDVFSQKLAYLRSVDSSWDKEYKYKEKRIKMKESDFLNKLNIKSNKINSINIKRYKTNRIKTITINNKKFKGTKFRQLLSLRSTDIDIEIKDGIVYINTRGYGHGVGMSQYGANSMAKKGYKYNEILNYYYQNINISV